MTAIGESPVEWPKTSGSKTWPISISLRLNSTSTQTTVAQPGSTAMASSSGPVTVTKRR